MAMMTAMSSQQLHLRTQHRRHEAAPDPFVSSPRIVSFCRNTRSHARVTVQQHAGFRQTGPAMCRRSSRLRLARQHDALSPAAAAAALTSSESLFAISTLYCVPLTLLIALAGRWGAAYRIVLTDLIFVPLALMYAVLLVRSWQPDTLSLMMPGSLADGFAGGKVQVQFVPKLSGIMLLFARAPTAASLWVHLLCINMFAARWIMLDGLRQRVPSWYSVLVASAFGPLGVFVHFFTQVCARLKGTIIPGRQEAA